MNHVHVPTLQMVTLLQKERKWHLQLKMIYKVKQIRQGTAGWSLGVTNVLRWSFQKQITCNLSHLALTAGLLSMEPH